MSVFDLSGDLSHISGGLRKLERDYLTAGTKAANDIQTHLHQFSSVHPMTTLHRAVQQFPEGRCFIAVNEALDAANRRMVEMLEAAVKGVKFSQVSGVLKDIAKEMAVYLGGGAVVGGVVGGALGAFAWGIGAGPGAGAGAMAGIELANRYLVAKGLVEFDDAIKKVMPKLCRHMATGFATAVRAGLVAESNPPKYRELMNTATESFAQGKLILVIALLAAIVALVVHKGMTVAMETIGASKLGTGFAEWLKTNQAIVREHPLFRENAPAAAQAPALEASAKKPVPVEPEAPKIEKNIRVA